MSEEPPPVVSRLWLTDFRCFSELSVELADGLTVLVGANGQGKTSVLEAIGWIARGRSFRGVADRVLVRVGTEQAVVRGEVREGSRRQLLEAEIRSAGRNRVLLNRNPVQRQRELFGLVRVTVFAPDDLALVKGGPAERRGYLDDLLVTLAPRYEAARADFERVLKQRNALLKGGLRGPDDAFTLDVFDSQLVAAGAELVRGRLRLLDRLEVPLDEAYRALAKEGGLVGGAYRAEWAEGALVPEAVDDVEALLGEALARVRRHEVERGLTLVGPHRDEWQLEVGGLDARSHASQGEQRTLALALRLAGHAVVTETTGTAPVLLLDDVFSELDDERSAALVARLPGGQTLLTTAGAVPEGVAPDRRLRIADGRIEDRA